MNKEYKLLKKYPSLSADWEVGMVVGLGDRNYGYSPCAGNYSDCRKLDNSEVENNSEYWELVVEKVYEILSFSYHGWGDSLAVLEEGNNYRLSDTSVWGLDSLLHKGYCVDSGDVKIHSVKRLSDNEVFTINDKIFYGAEYTIHCIRIDKEFNQGIEIWIEDGHCFLPLNQVKKVNSPLFITEDGVEMFDGDVVFCLHRNDDGNLSGVIADNVSVSKYPFDKSVPCFSTLFAAKKFIKENQKRYSLNDIKETVNKLGCFSPMLRLIEYLENEI